MKKPEQNAEVIVTWRFPRPAGRQESRKRSLAFALLVSLLTTPQHLEKKDILVADTPILIITITYSLLKDTRELVPSHLPALGSPRH